MSPNQRAAHYNRAPASQWAVTLLCAALVACSSPDLSEAALARGCIDASGDNRAKLAASWLSSAKVEVEGSLESGNLIAARIESED